MTFMCIVSLSLIILAAFIDSDISTSFEHQKEIWEEKIFGNENLLNEATIDQLKKYCELDKEISNSIFLRVTLFKDIKLFCAVSYSASLFAYFMTVFSKQNVLLEVSTFLYQGLMIFSGYYIYKILDLP